MTNQERIEELFHIANELCLFQEMHKIVEDLMKKTPYMEFHQIVELAFLETKKIYEETLIT